MITTDALIKNQTISFINGHTIPIFQVIIHMCGDTNRYWAECPMDNGAAFTDGDTLQEVQKNMYESISLYLQDDYPDINEFSLEFVISNE